MNLFELLTILFVVAVGYFGGRYFGGNYGVLGWIGGFIAGVFWPSLPTVDSVDSSVLRRASNRFCLSLPVGMGLETTLVAEKSIILGWQRGRGISVGGEAAGYLSRGSTWEDAKGSFAANWIGVKEASKDNVADFGVGYLIGSFLP